MCILYISGFNLHTPFYLKKKTKNNLHNYDATTAHKGTFIVECARVRVCVSVNACMHAPVFWQAINLWIYLKWTYSLHLYRL